MDTAGDGAPIDSRRVRFEQGIVAVAILAGFVFRVPLVLPALGAVLAAGAILGPSANPFNRAYDTLLAPRLGPAVHVDDPGEARFADILGVGVLAGASVCLLVGLGGLAWILALVQAVASALRATAGIHVASPLYTRLRRR